MQPDSAALAQPARPSEREIVEELERIIGERTFDHWFRDKASIEVGDRGLTVGVENAFLLSWLQRRFRPALADAARRLLGDSAEVRFEARTPASQQPPLGQDSAAGTGSALTVVPPGDSRGSGEARGPEKVAAFLSSAALPSTARSRPDRRDHRCAARPVPHPEPSAAEHSRQDHSSQVVHPAARSAATSRPAAGPGSASRGAGSSGGHGAGERRFEDLADFVPGPCNELALTAALQVCESPGTRYNPLVIYGGVGTGKTHLLEGLCRRLRSVPAASHVLLISAESFANCFIQALRERSLPSFRQRFRTVGTLMVDDVDFLDGKRVIQEEFLHTVNQLQAHQRQIVLTSDRHPRLLTRLGEDLVTRMVAGIVCRIEAPDLATRRAIAARKAARFSVRISEEALEFVVARFSRNVRELEGALNRLETLGLMTGKPVSAAAARQILAELERDCIRAVRLPDVEQTVCRFFGVEPAALRSARRVRSLSQPRMLAMYLARKLTGAAYSEIGEYFGGRNHSTVISAERRVRRLLDASATVAIAAQSWNVVDLMSSLEQLLLTG
jgi:chromosomal replication initiator protein